jgi:hypothetical protein
MMAVPGMLAVPAESSIGFRQNEVVIGGASLARTIASNR